MFKAIADNIPQMAWMSRSNGPPLWQNKRLLEYQGEPHTVDDWDGAVHPDHIERVSSGFYAATKAKQVFEDTFPIKGKNGEYRWFLSRAVPIDWHDGQPMYFGTDTDVTESVESTERLKTLMREVDHRSKNMLEIIQSIIAFTKSPDINDFTQSLTLRIAALGRTQSLLADANWENVELGEAVIAQFSPMLNVGEGSQVSVSGPRVLLKPKPAEALLMALHELATNAIKHGALSIDSGRVQLDWTRRDGGGLTINWREKNGPKIKDEPSELGFGMELIETLFGADDRVFLRWRADGLEAEVHLPSGAFAEPISENASSKHLVKSRPLSPNQVLEAEKTSPARILVVEDEKMIARLMVRRLESTGHSVEGPAHSVEQALSLIANEKKIDAAFVDWNLNGEAAIPVLEKLRTLGVPFCVATGNAALAIEQGFEKTLGKPFSADAFAIALSTLLAEKTDEKSSCGSSSCASADPTAPMTNS